MKNKINTHQILLAASIIGIVLLSGCVENTNTTKTTPIETSTPIVVKTLTPETTPSNLTVTKINASSVKTESSNTTNSTVLTAPGSDWCTVGNNVTVAGTIFTILGLTTDDKGNTLCKAEAIIPNGKATYLFSKDGNISKMNSSASSSNGNVSVNANSSVNS